MVNCFELTWPEREPQEKRFGTQCVSPNVDGYF